MIAIPIALLFLVSTYYVVSEIHEAKREILKAIEEKK